MEKQLVMKNGLNAFYNFASPALRNPALESRLLGRRHQLVRHLLHADQKERKGRIRLGNRTRRVDAILQWHPQVEDRQIRRLQRHFLDGIYSIHCFTANLPIGMGLEQPPKQPANRGIIVRDQYPYRHEPHTIARRREYPLRELE